MKLFFDRALNKLVGLELAKAKRELNEIEAKINDFEIKYNMQSEDFAEKFRAGLVDHSGGFIEWISFMDMRNILKEQTNRLISMRQGINLRLQAEKSLANISLGWILEL